MSDDEYEEYMKKKLVKNGWNEKLASKEAKSSVKDRIEDKSYFIKQGWISASDTWPDDKKKGKK